MAGKRTSLDPVTTAIRAAASQAVEAALNQYLVSLRQTIPLERVQTRKAIKRYFRKGALGGVAGLVFPGKKQFPARGTITQGLAEDAYATSKATIISAATAELTTRIGKLPMTTITISEKD